MTMSRVLSDSDEQRHPWNLSAEAFIRYAVEVQLDWHGDENRGVDDPWESPLFRLVRLLKGYFSDRVDVEQLFDHVERVVAGADNVI